MQTKLKTDYVAIILLVGGCTLASAYLKLPSYIKPCSINDPDLDECGKKHGNEAIPQLVKGDPTYKIPVLDPLVVEELRVQDTSKTSASTLDIVISNMSIHGLADSRILRRTHDFKKRSIYTEFLAPKLDVTAVYNMVGKVLTLPIKGHGQTNLTIENLRVNYRLNYDLITKKNGKRFYSTRDTSMSYNITGGHIYLTDLFNGNKELGDQMNAFLNENFMDVFEQVGPAIGESMNELFKRINANIFNLIPFEEFYTDLPKA